MTLLNLVPVDPLRGALTAATAALGLTLGGAHAERAELCGEIRDVSWELMEVRQSGVPLADVLELTSDPEVRMVVVSAYAVSRGETPAQQYVRVREFANGVFDQCMADR